MGVAVVCPAVAGASVWGSGGSCLWRKRVGVENGLELEYKFTLLSRK
jgi:hypothetical protein